ncbi:MAG: phosphoribosylanthranilate isomerase [Burkholderiaceae bacterium]|nr:phosphoribosylanthranilate isomerase [Burkholderiaceae bacterium]
MRTRIKVCGLTREPDVDDAVEAGVDAIGFVFYEPSPRSVSIQQAQRLARRVPAWVCLVGLFVNAPRNIMLSVADEVGLSHLQLHGDESPDDCRGLGRPVIKALRIGSEVFTPGAAQGNAIAQRVAAYEDCHAVLFDADSVGFGGSGQSFDWGLLEGVFARAPRLESSWVLSGGLESGSVGQAIARLRPPCVDVSSGVEARENGKQLKGIKDARRIREFVASVRVADALRP